MHTAQHLVNNCLAGDLVRGRTVILVTHHIALCLPISSYLVELSRGSVIRNGPIEGFEEKVLQKVIEIEDEPFLSEDREDLPLPAQENEADALQSNVQTLREQPLLSKDGKLIEVEARAEGRVSLKTYITYIKAAGTMSWIVTFLLMLAIRFINIGNQVSSISATFPNLKRLIKVWFS